METVFYTAINIHLSPRFKKREMHGLRSSPSYNRWKSMVQRCTNSKYKEYYLYGGRGIGVCESWLFFTNFLNDMGVPPHGLQLDRIDNNKGYFKENCRWATPLENVLNRRKGKNKKRKYRGVYKSSKTNSYDSQIRINGHNYHIGCFSTPEMARDAHLLIHKEWYGFYPID